MGHTFSQNLYHIIFSTKERRCLLGPACHEELKRYLAGVARNLAGHALNCNCTEDHLHALLRIPAAVSVSDFVGRLKSNTSRWLRHEQGLREFGWQAGFASFSVSVSEIPHVSAYIDGQQEHHRRLPFAEELRLFLEKHGVEYDPQHYLD